MHLTSAFLFTEVNQIIKQNNMQSFFTFLQTNINKLLLVSALPCLLFYIMPFLYGFIFKIYF